jgi:opacity protein-like surface antigen
MKRILIALILASLALPAAAATLGVKAFYLMPSEQAFKDIYGSGPMYGGELGFKIAGPVNLWIDGMYYRGKGKLTYTEEDTTLTLIPIGAGVRVDLPKGAIVPYAGAGLRYYIYKEENVIGTVKKNGLGFVGFAGVNFRIAKGFLFDLRAAFSSCQMTPADFAINVGGIELGGGLVIEF